MRLRQAKRLINLRVSFLVSKHCPASQVNVVSGLTGIRQGSWPFRYLGCILYKGRKKCQSFQHLIDMVNAKLQGWVRKLLSPGGRLVLIKHVLSAIPIHVLAVMEPFLNHMNIERLFSKCFWGEYGRRSEESMARMAEVDISGCGEWFGGSEFS